MTHDIPGGHCARCPHLFAPVCAGLRRRAQVGRSSLDSLYVIKVPSPNELSSNSRSYCRPAFHRCTARPHYGQARAPGSTEPQSVQHQCSVITLQHMFIATESRTLPVDKSYSRCPSPLRTFPFIEYGSGSAYRPPSEASSFISPRGCTRTRPFAVRHAASPFFVPTHGVLLPVARAEFGRLGVTADSLAVELVFI